MLVTDSVGPADGRHRANLQAELDGAALYRTLAELEEAPALAEVYDRLAASEERHAEFWRAKLWVNRIQDLPTGPRWRTHLLIRLARRFGPWLVLPTVAARERADEADHEVDRGNRRDIFSLDAQTFLALVETALGLAHQPVLGQHRLVGQRAG